MAYNFDKTFRSGEFEIKVDTAARYGYFEHDELGDECGGGLWFETHSSSTSGDAGLVMELIDYDGVYSLPKSVAKGLVENGYYLDPELYAEELA